MIELRVSDYGLVRSAEVFSPFWIDWVKFDVLGDGEVIDILEELLTHVHYGYNYLGPRELHHSFEDAHGPYVLSAMNTSLYELVTPMAAKTELYAWLIDRSEPEWTFRTLGLSFIASLPDSGTTFRLPHVDSIPVTELAWIVGGDGGFNEWIFIDEARKTLTVVVASDD